MAFVSPSGWMKMANVLPLIARKRDRNDKCLAATAGTLAAASERRAVRFTTGLDKLPAIRSRCPAPAAATGVRDGAIIKRLPGAAEATLPLQSSGGAGERWWFLNGEPLTERGRNVTPAFDG